MRGAPAELAALQQRMAELSDLGRIHSMLFWDQNTMMPPNGALARADHASTLEVIAHGKLIDPEIGRLLDALEPWAASEDPDSDAVRLLAAVRRDHEKAARVPTELAAEMATPTRSGSRPGRRRAPHRTSACSATRCSATSSCATAMSPASSRPATPTTSLLDDFEPGLTTAELRPLFASCATSSSRSSPRPPATTARPATTASSPARSRSTTSAAR